MFVLVLIGLVVVFSYGIGNVSAASNNTIYINVHGNDNWDGLNSTHISGISGPKATIQNGTDTVKEGGTVYVANGVYHEHITINRNMTIIGQSTTGTIIDGMYNGQPLTINSEATVKMTNFTVQNGWFNGLGYVFGSGIHNYGNLTMTRCNVINNSVTATSYGLDSNAWAQGGGIFNEGILNMTGCNIKNNSVTTIAGNAGLEQISIGAGVVNTGSMTIKDCNIINNTAISQDIYIPYGFVYGGGIYNSGTLNITGCNIINNTVISPRNANGGGIYNRWALYITECNIVNNTVISSTPTYANGGGIFNGGSLTANFNRLIGNTPIAMYNGNTILSVEDNWWGSNSNPSNQIYGVSNFAWIYMTITAHPSTIYYGSMSALTVSFNNLYNGTTITKLNPTKGHIPDDTPVTFKTTLGSIKSPLSTVNGVATSTLVSGLVSGIANVSTTVDNQTVHTLVTIDTIPPKVKTIDPANNEVNVPANKVIKVTFNKPIKAGTMWIELKNSNRTLIHITASITGNVLTIIHNALLQNGKYTLGLHTSSITDLDGNPLAIWGSSFTIYSTPPKVKIIDPANNSINVPTNKVIKVTFNKPIKAGTMWIELKNSSRKLIHITTSITGNVLTITHKALLQNGKYTLGLHTGSITDLDGNPLTIWGSSFTIYSTPPKVKTIDPANNSINVPTNKVIKVTFNKPIKAGTMWIELRNNSDTLIPVTASINGNILTIKHPTLSKGVKYTMELHSRCITDLAGNPLKAWITKFTTTKN